MLTYIFRRLLIAVPTLLLISLVIFLLVDLAPGSPMSEIPLTVPPEVKKKMIEAMIAHRNDQYLWWQVAEYTYDNFMIRARARGG